MDETTKFVRISWNCFEKDCFLLARKLKKYRIDRIIAVTRGGLVPARILADLLSIPISHITIVSYADLKQKKEPEIIETSFTILKDEIILIVDDVSDTGKTFQKAIAYFNKFIRITGNRVKKIYTSSVYIKPWTKFVPDFYCRSINAWIIFPYELKETVRAFLKMFPNKKTAIKKLTEAGYKKWELRYLLDSH